MPTLRQRFLGLAGTDAERQRRYRRAWQWARQRVADHEVHVRSSIVRLFPDGGLDSASAYGDAEFETFGHWIVFAYISYISLI